VVSASALVLLLFYSKIYIRVCDLFGKFRSLI
ncbi:hypothetical protein LSH36_338g04010, partial [Paralvinella palmiformis]